MEELAKEIRTVLSESPFLGRGPAEGEGATCGQGDNPGRQEPGAPADEGARTAGAGEAGYPPRRPEPQRPDPHRAAGRTLGHGRVAVLDESGGLAPVLRGRRPLRLGCRRLAQWRRKGDRWAPLEPVSRGVRAHMGGFGKAIALGPTGARSSGRGSSRPRSGGSASARHPPMWASRSATVSPSASSGRSRRSAPTCTTSTISRRPGAVIGTFIEHYKNGWLLQRHGCLTPARAREKLSRRAA